MSDSDDLFLSPDDPASTDADPIADFEVAGVLGEGGASVVHRAVYRPLEVEVALKVFRGRLDDDQRRRFLKECRGQWRLGDHPNVSRLYWAGVSETGQAWLAVELAETSLAARLRRDPVLTRLERDRIATDLLSGLAAIHEAGLLHRDVKPANVLLDVDGRASLADFGLALVVDEWTSDNAAGTTRFLAPEVAAGGAPTTRADVYAAGITLRALYDENVPGGLESLLTRAASHAPEDRPADGTSFLEQFRSVVPLPPGASAAGAVASATDEPDQRGDISERYGPGSEGVDRDGPPGDGSGPGGDGRPGWRGRIGPRVVLVAAAVLTAVALAGTWQLVGSGAAGRAVSFTAPRDGGLVGGQARISVVADPAEVSRVDFSWRLADDIDWRPLDSADEAPYVVYQDVTDLADGTPVVYRAQLVDEDDEIRSTEVEAVVGPPELGDADDAPDPEQVSLPSTFQDDIGCPERWKPGCPAIDLKPVEDGAVWTGTFRGDREIPAGKYFYKVAHDDSWDQSYGHGARHDGDEIAFETEGGPVRFWYSPSTHWATSSAQTPDLYTVPGSFQNELGCSADFDPGCLRTWLQDPDEDGVWSFRTESIPAGKHRAKVAQDLSWDVNWGADGEAYGDEISFEVADGEGVLFSFDAESTTLTVSTYAPGS